MGKRGKFRRALLATVCLGTALVVAPAAPAQQVATITGRITDASSGQPVAAAQVNVVGTTLGAQANQEGIYTIRGVPTGAVQVRALRVGYAEMVQSVNTAAGQATTLNFVMKPVAVMLTPTVVTATGEQRRVEVGNAIAQVDAAKLVETRPISNMGDLLTARAPGVQVIGGNSTGTGARVRIRGTSSLSLSNDPIYVIDGVRMQSSTNSQSIGIGGSTFSRMNDLNPDDIESIEVVRGPSAATLYGTDAANGVIVITTKKGVAGKPQWTLFTQQSRIVDRNPWPANYTGFGRFTARANTPNTASCFITRQVLPTTDNNYCALDSIASFSPSQVDSTSPIGTGHLQSYGMQVRGGSEMVKYFASGEWENERGLQTLPSSQRNMLQDAQLPVRDYVENPNQSRKATARANLSVTLPSNADFSINTGFIHGMNTLPPSDNNANGWVATIVGGTGSPNAGGYPYGFYDVANVYQQQFEQDIDRFIGSVNSNWHPKNWLSFRSNAGLDFTNRVDTFLCRFTECTSGTQQEGTKSDNRANFYTYTLDASGTGSFQPKSWLGSKTTLGVQFYRDLFYANTANATKLPPGATTVSAGAVPTAGESTTESRTLGVFAEEALSFNERLFVTGALRSDNNSAFGADFKAVYYPKVSVSWVASDESFFPRMNWLNQLRLRGAYGASGRQPGTTDAVQFYSTQTAIAAGVEKPGIVFNALGNTKLKPERSTELETGIDLTAWDSRINTELTFYSKSSRDALIREIIPGSVGSGATSRFANLGEIRNSGVEYLIGAQILQRDEFGWDVSLNGSHNSNKIVSLGGTPPQRGSQISQLEGYPLNSWFMKPYTYNDANGNGVIEASEVTVGDTAVFAGYSQPRTEISFTNGIDLWRRRVRLTALVDYKGGYKIWNGTTRYRCVSFSNCRDLYDTKTPLDKQARLVAARFVTSTTDYGYVEDGSFLRLREIAMNFDLPSTWAARYARANRMALNLSARNLHIWTKYTGIDPESNYGQNDVQNDFLTQPPQTYFQLRVTLGY